MKIAISALFISVLTTSALAAPKPGCPFAKRGKERAELQKRILPEVGFDPSKQFVSTSGDHQFQPPGPTDIRGPCPGLNALANHGYFDRSGVTTLTQAIEAVNVVYGISPELGTALSAYAVIFDGNVLDQTWSIGGPNPSSGLGSITNLLGGEPSGINGHSVYEADSSVSRADYFLNNGDDYSLQLPFFQDLVTLANNDSTEGKDVYTFDVLAQHRHQRFQHSLNNNPNFFFSAFGGFLVTTAAHDFIQNFMSNHSEEFPGGYLDEKNLFSFFSIYRHPENGSIYHVPGYERIPDNWYKRPVGSEYTLVDVVTGVLKYGQKYPEVLAIGGNTGKVNSFTGVNLANITGGVYNAQNLLQGNNLACFIYSAVVQQAIPSQLQFIYKTLTPVVDSLLKTLTGSFSSLNVGCPQLQNIDWPALYAKYPGSKIGGKFGN